MILGVALILSSCGCCTTQVVAYRAVAVRPVVTPVIVDYVEPVDVTTTTLQFY